MRVVVWNMGHWTKSKERVAQAWQDLDDLEPDIALLQEVVRPADRVNVVYRQISNRRPWGSAIVGYGVELDEISEARGRYNSAAESLHRTHPGSVAVAGANVGGRAYTFISIYGLIENGYADTTVNRQLSDLAPLLDSTAHEGRIVMGGDLNITTQWAGREARYRQWEQATFTRIEAFGLRDLCDHVRPVGRLEGCSCPDADGCRHIRTQYHSNSAMPFQNDYAFASSRLVESGIFQSAEVLDQEPWARSGEHLPIVLEFAD